MKRDTFTLPLALLDELIIDNFAGGGGASTGIERAFGRSVDVAVNHNAEALAMHAANHPHTAHYCESVWDVDPIEVTKNQPVGLVWLSPDCFPAGTLVMTDKGYRAIESIQVGDQVLTHKLRWRAVTECSSTVRPLIEIRGHGHPGLRVSPEHPFYSREQHRTWNNDRRSYDYALKAPDWTPASAVQKGLYWGSPCTFPESVAPDVAGRGIDMTDDLLWLAGRYVGDGWTRLTDTRAEVVITCGKHEIERLRPLLNRWLRAGGRAVANELEWHERHTSTAYQFTTNHRGLVEWLREHFGHRAEAKGIPAWALGLPVAARESLLEGYLSADGHKFDDFVEAHTVSKSLAFGIKALANSLGKTVAVYCRPNSAVIQGREVNARDLFKVRWRHAVHSEHAQTYTEDGIEWCPVRKQSAACESAEVFNIGVEEDESYVVEGIIVHNCKHFSKAKGGKPVEKKIRGLAWVALRWAAKCKPRVIMLENVEEFRTWGPLQIDTEGNARPDPSKKGQTFRSFVRQLEGQGYAVDWRELRACDYGAPTIRKRFFMVARRDGLPICWPKPTHGAPGSKEVKAGKLLPWRTAAECIDWSIPCPSIFERKKPLAEATLRRIAKGVMRYVVESGNPFIVPQAQDGAHVAPALVQTGYGEREGQAPRALDIGKPLGTVVGGAAKHALVSAFLAKHYTGVVGSDLRDGLGTITSSDHHSLVTAHMVTIDNQSSQSGQTAITAPLKTTVTENRHALVTSNLVKLRGTSSTAATDEPLHTVSAGGQHHAEVRAFLLSYYGTDQDPQIGGPLATVTSRDRFGLVTIKGQDYRIVDIGLRMLSPRELFHAQGFPANYIIGDDAEQGLHLTKSAQVRMCGNSVCPPLSEALVRANFAHEALLYGKQAA